MAEQQLNNLLVGMKAICKVLNGISEATALKWHREFDLPIKKTGKAGYWVASREKLEEWARDLASK